MTNSEANRKRAEDCLNWDIDGLMREETLSAIEKALDAVRSAEREATIRECANKVYDYLYLADENKDILNAAKASILSLLNKNAGEITGA